MEKLLEGNPTQIDLKELPISFTGRGEVKGFIFLQHIRSNNAYIYEVCDTYGNKWHEVFKRIIDARFNKIAYPKAKSFGISAWTSKTLVEAEQRFHKITYVHFLATDCNN